MSQANVDQIAFWNAAAAETWVALQDRLDRQIDPLGRAALARLAPAPGQRILDVGCGCGQTTMQLAEAVGRGGGVLGVDVSAPMLAEARRRAKAAGLDQARFEEADAQTAALPAAAFDAAYSRLGVMFFDDPVAAFRNLAGALRPGGRLAFVCWRSLPENAWMTVPLVAALPHLPPPEPPVPGAPGPFAFADAARVHAILSEAGFAEVRIDPRDDLVRPDDLDEAVDTALRVGPLGSMLRERPDRVGVVVDAVRAALEPHAGPHGVGLAAAAWIVHAVRA